MSVFTVCGDPHFQSDNKDYANKLFDKLESIGNDVIILGDMFHYKRIVQADAFNLAFKRIQESKLRYIIMVGNHDLFNESSKEHSLEPFKVLPNVKIVDEPTVVKVQNTVLGLLPYYGNLDEFRTAVKGMSDSVHILFIHQGVNNFDMGNGHLETAGIGLNELEDFPLVIGGHLHKHQVDKNLVLLGTPKSHSFGESDQEKFLGVLCVRELDLEFIPTGFPKHITLTYDCDTNGPFPTYDTVNHNRCILTGSEENVANFNRGAHKSMAFIASPHRAQSEVLIKETDSNEQKFVKWAIDIKKLDESTITAGLEVLKSVL